MNLICVRVVSQGVLTKKAKKAKNSINGDPQWTFSNVFDFDPEAVVIDNFKSLPRDVLEDLSKYAEGGGGYVNAGTWGEGAN